MLEEVFAKIGTDFRGTLQERMRIEFSEVTSQRVVARMPVAGNGRSFGMLHGGASCVFAETMATVGAALHAPPGHLAIGIEISATHHRAVKAGQVTGVATAVHLGRTLASYDVVISDERERRICTARVTCLVRPAKSLPVDAVEKSDGVSLDARSADS
ncbi:PaaI family thioesterase [Virgisporangium aliadipatigenens]|uniref:PaaI family thioesterase n=1 Tax=Virgisporangium aliadipatigenens TaxID=741659 RepID=UPI001EF3CCC3|nr:hotdog fold thioesterase [Virgisporangium aliadipatigenens]